MAKMCPPPAKIADQLLTDFLGANLRFDPLPLNIYAQTEWKDDRPVVTVNSFTGQIPGVKDIEGIQNVAMLHEAVHVERDISELKSGPQLTLPDFGPPTKIVSQIPHLDKRKTSLEPDAMRGKMFCCTDKPSPTRAPIMKQGLLAFQYEEEKSTTGMTALSGLMTYVELMHVAGLRSSVERRVGLRGGGQGWTDSQIITSLILLNLAGGESVMDLEVLEKDAGLCRVLRHAETHGMRRRERRALKARWRGERWRSVPSDSVVFRYLERFHDAGEEAKREAHRAFIPPPTTL